MEGVERCGCRGCTNSNSRLASLADLVSSGWPYRTGWAYLAGADSFVEVEKHILDIAGELELDCNCKADGLDMHRGPDGPAVPVAVIHYSFAVVLSVSVHSIIFLSAADGAEPTGSSFPGMAVPEEGRSLRRSPDIPPS